MGDLACAEPMGAFGKMAGFQESKDTITGHWEIAGIYTDTPFKTYRWISTKFYKVSLRKI